MKKLFLLEEELAASGNCEHWVKLEFSDGDYMVDVSATECISNADGEVGNAFPAIPINREVPTRTKRAILSGKIGVLMRYLGWIFVPKARKEHEDDFVADGLDWERGRFFENAISGNDVA